MRTVSQVKKKWKLWKLGLAVIAGYAILICLASIMPGPDLVGNRCLPKWLQGEAHTDYYLSWTRWIPRSATSWCIDEAPVQLLGNQKEKAVARNGAVGPKPIPGPGEWQMSAVQLKNGWPLFLPYFAFTTKGGTHLRIGCRWDDVDHYYTFPSFALAVSP